VIVAVPEFGLQKEVYLLGALLALYGAASILARGRNRATR
jgi:hypothetical protein